MGSPAANHLETALPVLQATSIAGTGTLAGFDLPFPSRYLTLAAATCFAVRPRRRHKPWPADLDLGQELGRLGDLGARDVILLTACA
jgi:hypothetical protein